MAPRKPPHPQRPFQLVRRHRWPGLGKTLPSLQLAQAGMKAPQQHQVGHADQNNTTKPLKINLPLESWPTKVDQDLHAKPKQSDHLRK